MWLYAWMCLLVLLQLVTTLVTTCTLNVHVCIVALTLPPAEPPGVCNLIYYAKRSDTCCSLAWALNIPDGIFQAMNSNLQCNLGFLPFNSSVCLSTQPPPTVLIPVIGGGTGSGSTDTGSTTPTQPPQDVTNPCIKPYTVKEVRRTLPTWCGPHHVSPTAWATGNQQGHLPECVCVCVHILRILHLATWNPNQLACHTHVPTGHLSGT